MTKEEGLFAEVIYSPQARVVESVSVDLGTLKTSPSKGYALREVIAASNILQRYSELGMDALSIGVWGKRITINSFIQAGARVEIYRNLLVDPKEARRLRYKKQGTIQTRCRPKGKGA